MIKTQFNSPVEIVRSNIGTKFFNNQCPELFQHYGILDQSSCPYTLQKNGIVKRIHRHILEIAREIRFQSKLPIKFREFCIQVAVY